MYKRTFRYNHGYSYDPSSWSIFYVIDLFLSIKSLDIRPGYQAAEVIMVSIWSLEKSAVNWDTIPRSPKAPPKTMSPAQETSIRHDERREKQDK